MPSENAATTASYAEILAFAYELAERATKIILDGQSARWAKSTQAESKKNSVDLVTETDQAVEEMIKSSISKRYPTHKFIGEESFAAGERQELTDDYTWIIDPVDGTMNFVHGYPFVACSIGVAHQRRPVVGVIALPFLHQIYSAYEGGGAFMNRTIPLPLTGGVPQPLNELSQCILSAEWGSDRSGATVLPKGNSFIRLAGDPKKGIEGGLMAHALRTTGSSACNLALVCAGQLDIYWDAGCWSWDICAGAIILKEAGGFVTGGKEAFEKDQPIGEFLMNRRYTCVRALAPSETETTEQIQRRLVKELYAIVEEWTNEDMK